MYYHGIVATVKPIKGIDFSSSPWCAGGEFNKYPKGAKIGDLFVFGGGYTKAEDF